MRGLWGGGVLGLYSGGVSKSMVSVDLRRGAGSGSAVRSVMRALGMG